MSKIRLSDIKNNPELVNEIQVKKYISITEKQMTINGFADDDGNYYPGIIDSCLEKKDGMYFINYFRKEMLVNLAIVQSYCDNVEFDEIENENMTMYDFYNISGILKKVIDNIPDLEYWKFTDFVDSTLQQELDVRNSVSAVLNRGIEDVKIILEDKAMQFIKIVEKNTDPNVIKKLFKSLFKDVKGLDMDKMGFLKDIFVGLNGLGKEGKDNANLKTTAKVGGVIGKDSK